MIVEHAQAVRDLLAASAHTLYVADVPDRPSYPYRVLWLDTGADESTHLCGGSDQAGFRFWVTSVGLTDESVRIVVDDGRARLVDTRPAVPGRACDPIRRETSLPVRPDTDVTDPDTNRHPLFAVDTYHFVSHTA